jgi:hypothetical protein
MEQLLVNLHTSPQSAECGGSTITNMLMFYNNKYADVKP